MSSTFMFLTAMLGYKAGETVTLEDEGQIAFLDGVRYVLRYDPDTETIITTSAAGADSLVGAAYPEVVIEDKPKGTKRNRQSEDPSDDPDEIVID